MNYWFISAGAILTISLLIHMIAGDKDYNYLDPRKHKNRDLKMFESWLMGRGTFQMVSIDLLLSAIALSLMGLQIMPYSQHLTIFIAFLFGGYLIFWLATLFFSKAKSSNYIKQGQWILFLIVFVLIILGI